MRIGVFDSGVGGITVLRELRSHLPLAVYRYLGDTANLPYGTKSADQVRQLAMACVDVLLKKRVQAIVVACNTASAVALDEMRAQAGDVPVIGVVEPGAEAALEALAELEARGPFEKVDAPPVLVLATRATVRSGAYGQLLREKLAASRVIEQACPLLVPMIEEGWVDHSILHATLDEYLRSYREKYRAGVALLGCTHYPWIQPAIERALPGWTVVNSAFAVVRALERRGIEGLVTEPGQESPGHVEWTFTDPKALPSFALPYLDETT